MPGVLQPPESWKGVEQSGSEDLAPFGMHSHHTAPGGALEWGRALGFFKEDPLNRSILAGAISPTGSALQLVAVPGLPPLV